MAELLCIYQPLEEGEYQLAKERWILFCEDEMISKKHFILYKQIIGYVASELVHAKDPNEFKIYINEILIFTRKFLAYVYGCMTPIVLRGFGISNTVEFIESLLWLDSIYDKQTIDIDRGKEVIDIMGGYNTLDSVEREQRDFELFLSEGV